MTKPIIAVWFSKGAASAVAAKKTIELYGDEYDVRVITSHVIEEHADNFRFSNDVEKWLGVKIEVAGNPKFPWNSARNVWAKRKYMNGIEGAPCTYELKKMPRYIWEARNYAEWHVFGFCAEEWKRHDDFVRSELANVLPVLIKLNISKQECIDILQEAGIAPPYIYRLGYPNANCIGCVKATSPTYWNHVRKMHPDVFEDRAKQSRELGAKLVRINNERIYLDELDPLAQGRPLKSMQIECSPFCASEDGTEQEDSD